MTTNPPRLGEKAVDVAWLKKRPTVLSQHLPPGPRSMNSFGSMSFAQTFNCVQQNTASNFDRQVSDVKIQQNHTSLAGDDSIILILFVWAGQTKVSLDVGS